MIFTDAFNFGVKAWKSSILFWKTAPWQAQNGKAVNCINLHPIILPLSDHPSEGIIEFESFDDNDIITENSAKSYSQKHELDETPKSNKRAKK